MYQHFVNVSFTLIKTDTRLLTIIQPDKKNWARSQSQAIHRAETISAGIERILNEREGTLLSRSWLRCNLYNAYVRRDWLYSIHDAQ